MKPVTLWYKIIEDKDRPEIPPRHVFNHLDDGWSTDAYPSPIDPSFTLQLNWAKEKWSKKHAYLDVNYKVLHPQY